jgi:hypothetical protein
VRTHALTNRRSRKIFLLFGAVTLLAVLYVLTVLEVRANPQSKVDRQPASEPLVIQGRVTGIQGTLVTVRLPDGFPARTGGHAQFVTAGPIFKVDVSHARVLLPDGKQIDKLPLAVGDHVIMVLAGLDAGSAEPGRVSTYSASVVERVVQGDKITTH